jgi:hypothetical protein
VGFRRTGYRPLGQPALIRGRREFAAEVPGIVPRLAEAATALHDVTVTGAWVGDLPQASLATSSRFCEPDATAWSNNTVAMLARNVQREQSNLLREHGTVLLRTGA